jgi:hypothetical protein
MSARVTLSGVPPQIRVRSIGIRSTLRFPDGTAVESSHPAGFSSFNGPAVEAALGARILSTRDLSDTRETWTPMITIREQDFVRHRGQSGRLEAKVDLITSQMRVVGTLPVTPGASLDRGVSRLDIAAVERGTDSRTVVIRRWRTQSLLSPEFTRDQTFAIRRRSSGEALMAGTENSWEVNSRPSAAKALLRLPLIMMSRLLPIALRPDGFSVGTLYLRFPGRGFGKAPPLDPTWFDNAELVVLEEELAGVVTRPLVIEEFVVPAN